MRNSPLINLSDADRHADVAVSLARGNHKSAWGHEAKLLETLKDEVKRGWQLPLPKEAALELRHCEVVPLGVVSQMTIGSDGAKETKLRLTHDQSFNATRGMRRSVNDRVVADKLTPVRFGRALLCFLHYTCRLKRQFPSERLLITKVDCKSAYRRVHLKAMTTPNPSQWIGVSEVIADLANDLVRRSNWDPVVWSTPPPTKVSTDERSGGQRRRTRPPE